MRSPRANGWAVLLLCCACTDAGIYASGNGGPTGPQAAFSGSVCVPLATGDQFPVKILLAVEGGAGVSPTTKGAIIGGINDFLSQQQVVGSLQFELIAFHTTGLGLQGSFVPSTQLVVPMTQLASYQEVGPVSLRSPLEIAQTFLSGDMQTSCRGLVARTRYVVVLVYGDPDTTCANPSFQLGLNSKCQALMPAVDQCGACELGAVTAQLKAIGDTYGAGQVIVQPIYVAPATTGPDGGVVSAPDPAATAEGQAIALAGSTQLIQTDAIANDFKTQLGSVDIETLARQFVLKRLFAFNRNAIARNGEMLTDTDGDGLSDAQEDVLKTDKLNPDTDGDGLGDGVEVKMGLDPLTANTINGCNPDNDIDGDRLKDCEEKVLGTDPCVSDTDGDGLPELVELLAGTNPLVPEDLQDSDRDGVINTDEVTQHSDPLSADNAYQQQHGYRYTINDAPPTVDGRACYAFTIENVTLAPTLKRPNPNGPLFADLLPGTNDIYLYFEMGRPNEPHGVGINEISVQQVRRLTPTTRKPAGLIQLQPSDFTLGQ